MDAKKHFQDIRTNLIILRELGLNIPGGDYLCPVCLSPFSEDNALELTEEDVPQDSLGGSRITLTCKDCNNNCGSLIDVHLQEAIKGIEQRQYLPNTDRKVAIEANGKRLFGKLIVGDAKEMKLEINTKANNPKVWDEYHEKVLLQDAVINLQDSPLKRNPKRINAAFVKNAYLILFSKTGFSILSDAFYDSFRAQILEPDVTHIPIQLWTFQNVGVPDGVYISNNDGLKGFFVVYSLQMRKVYKTCVFIPLPEADYHEVNSTLNNIVAGTMIQMKPLDSKKDYLTNKEHIEELRAWAIGK